MVSTPKPTDVHIRQHALDRALTSEVVSAVQAGLSDLEDMSSPSPRELAGGIVFVADAFAAYLRGEEPSEHYDEGTLRKVYESFLYLHLSENTARDVVTEMQNRGILFRERGSGPVPDPDVVEGEPTANLGLASTRELLQEVQVRLNRLNDAGASAGRLVSLRRSLSDETLDYRTVDHA